MLRRFISLNDRFARAVARISAWRTWMTILTVGTVLWIIADAISNDRIDPGKTILVLILTIQTSLDSQAQRLNQADTRERDLQHEAELRDIDLKREEQEAAKIEAIRELTIEIRTELARSADRDAAAELRDEASAVRDRALFELAQRWMATQEEGVN